MLLVVLGGCKKKGGTATPDDPGITVKDASEGLLLTWIDDKGDFHVEQKVADVPMMGRDAVRVVDPTKDEGTHEDKVFVVDLRQAKTDGTYPVTTMTRADFEKIAEDRREKRGPTLATAASALRVGFGVGAARHRHGTQGGTGEGRSLVIIYGAEWCGACHEAAAYLRRKGIPYVEKDIEKDPQAAREMQAKLRNAGMRSGLDPGHRRARQGDGRVQRRVGRRGPRPRDLGESLEAVERAVLLRARVEIAVVHGERRRAEDVVHGEELLVVPGRDARDRVAVELEERALREDDEAVAEAHDVRGASGGRGEIESRATSRRRA